MKKMKLQAKCPQCQKPVDIGDVDWIVFRLAGVECNHCLYVFKVGDATQLRVVEMTDRSGNNVN